MQALEREVLGCDFGGTSWTTQSQADRIPRTLGLVPGSHLLEIGAGTGWPGIYLSSRSGCDVTLLDVPVKSLRYARQRALDENLGGRCRAVAASGAALPFKSGTFRRICHSDVLCCLPEKLALLKECRRVARDGCKMLFYVIAPAHGLSAADLEKACSVGPPFVGVRDEYDRMLMASDWQPLQKTDLTSEYLASLRKLHEAMKTNAKSLEAVFGSTEFEAQLQHRCRQISVIEHGLLKREMYLVEVF